MANEDERSPLDDLVDLFLYAPVGLLYEYDEVIPKLVRRGKSQVQLARVLGKVAIKQGRGDSIPDLAETVGVMVGGAMARRITEFGEAIGLAPTPDAEADTSPGARSGGAKADPPPPAPEAPVPALEPVDGPAPATDDAETGAADDAADAGTGTGDIGTDDDRPLPIAGYDSLTAREIIGLLDELDAGQQARIRAHEEANRARKTVLGKLDRLQG